MADAHETMARGRPNATNSFAIRTASSDRRQRRCASAQSCCWPDFFRFMALSYFPMTTRLLPAARPARVSRLSPPSDLRRGDLVVPAYRVVATGAALRPHPPAPRHTAAPRPWEHQLPTGPSVID